MLDHRPTTKATPQPTARTIPTTCPTSHEPSIILQCRRRDLHTHYVQLTVHKHGLSIWYGNITQDNNRLTLHVAFENTEFIPYSLYPEAANVHDGNAWNIAEIHAWTARRFPEL